MTTTQPKWQTYGIYAFMALLALAMFMAGIQKLIGNEMLWQQFINFGYARWFFYLTGIIEVGAAILIWIPKTRLVGAVMIVVTMLGAAYSNLMTGGDATVFIPVNLVLALLAGVVAWNNRNSWPLK